MLVDQVSESSIFSLSNNFQPLINCSETMENNPNSDQNPDQLISDHKISSNDIDDHHQHQAIISQSSSSSSARSYECSFCKRGFTNAQALGGHMNIHRKDKAKLKQSANFSTHEAKQQQKTLEIPKNIAINPTYLSPNLPIIMSNSNLEGRDSASNINPSDVDDHGNIKTTTSWFLNQGPASVHDHERGLSSSDHGRRSSSDPELDLELRLGPDPEPPQEYSSSTAVATRKFF